MKTEIEKAVKHFFESEDIDNANDIIRSKIKTLEQARYAVAIARQMGEDVNDLMDVILSI